MSVKRRTIQAAFFSLKQCCDTQVMLSTAIVNTRDVRGKLHKSLCLLESALQVSFITEAMENILGMRRTRNYVPLKGINNVNSEARCIVNIQLYCKYSKFQAQVMCFNILIHVPCIFYYFYYNQQMHN
jgi:hypothetical protein